MPAQNIELPRRPLLTFWLIAVAIEFVLAAVFILTGADAAIETALDKAGIDFAMDFLTAIRAVLVYPAAMFAVLLALLSDSARMSLVTFADRSLDPAVAGRLRAASHAPDGRPLIAAVAQDADTGRVLMLAWMDASALAATLSTGIATYWSRSRQELWIKGATSGNIQRVRTVELDCDGDTVLLKVSPAGPACHTGLQSCFDTAELALT